MILIFFLKIEPVLEIYNPNDDQRKVVLQKIRQLRDLPKNLENKKEIFALGEFFIFKLLFFIIINWFFSQKIQVVSFELWFNSEI